MRHYLDQIEGNEHGSAAISLWVKAELGKCPLWVQSQHFGQSRRCLLYPRKQTEAGCKKSAREI